MDGVHDLGGVQGYGEVDVESGRTQGFAHRYEGTIFTMVSALGMAGVMQNIDRFRHAIERMDPQCYFAHGYYGRWLAAVETLLREADQLSDAEAASLPGGSDAVGARPGVRADPVPPEGPPSSIRPQHTPSVFSVGQTVVTRKYGVAGHTRLPRYAVGRTGVVTAHHGVWVYPDTNASLEGDQPCHLYTVRFDGRELWGDNADPDVRVHLDLFEPYLNPMEAAADG